MARAAERADQPGREEWSSNTYQGYVNAFYYLRQCEERKMKDPGPGGMRLAPAVLDMTFADAMSSSKLRMPDAYERLVMDVIRGDQTLFMRGDEVEAAWEWVDPIIAGWEERGDRPVSYDPGSSGPEDALMLLHRDGRRWREIAT